MTRGGIAPPVQTGGAEMAKARMERPCRTCAEWGAGGVCLQGVRDVAPHLGCFMWRQREEDAPIEDVPGVSVLHPGEGVANS